MVSQQYSCDIDAIKHQQYPSPTTPAGSNSNQKKQEKQSDFWFIVFCLLGIIVATVHLGDTQSIINGVVVLKNNIVQGFTGLISEAPKEYLAVCSGKGLLTADNKCFCDVGFTGPNCETKSSGKRFSYIILYITHI